MRNVKISTKLSALFTVTIVLVIAVILSMCLVNFHKELKRISSANQEMRIKVFWDLLKQKGDGFRIENDNLYIGDYLLNGNYELPDKVKELCSGTATIFMKDVRVSTNVMQSDGTRAVGTTLKGVAYDSIFKYGRSYRGEANILGESYFTAYDPIRSSRGEVIGVVYTGIKRSEFFSAFDKLQFLIIGISIFFAIIISLLVLFVLNRMITRPINMVVKNIQDIAEGQGDLTKRLTASSNDEIGVLARWFNRFIEDLEQIISKIKVTAYTLEGATQEVYSGSQGLSQATQEQASAIEEVAATIEEITASIKQNALNADKGKEKTSSMVDMANASGRASQELIKAMGEISASSKKIGDIITSVNEVAFQTNLLALNAAVEAARAGEHGKGFAVVADEVRALAKKSADAAKQIEELIEDTVKKVNAGDEIVKISVESLQKITNNINDVSMNMDEIASSCAEQSTGVDEVHRAIVQIDNTTQQNASTVEQLAGTSDNLKEEAIDLASTVERFKVSDF